MAMPKVNVPDFLGGLNELKAAAEAMRDAVQFIEANKFELEQQKQIIAAHERQLESLEKQYSELLYRFGEVMRR